jgi:hypothetical protein
VLTATLLLLISFAAVAAEPHASALLLRCTTLPLAAAEAAAAYVNVSLNSCQHDRKQHAPESTSWHSTLACWSADLLLLKAC